VETTAVITVMPPAASHHRIPPSQVDVVHQTASSLGYRTASSPCLVLVSLTVGGTYEACAEVELG